MLFRKFADPQTQSLAIPPLRFLVTNTNVPGRSTMRMVDAVGTLVGGPLGKSVGEPLLDAMGASRCMAFARLVLSARRWRASQGCSPSRRLGCSALPPSPPTLSHSSRCEHQQPHTQQLVGWAIG